MPLLNDGFRTLIAFPLLAPGLNLIMHEREVQPPELDGGGEIDTTTMRKLRWRGKWPKQLITMGDLVLQCKYDPVVYSTLPALMNRNSTITVTFPDGGVLTIWGWLAKVTPPSHKEGDMPLAEVRFIISNTNNAGVEVAPGFVAA